MLSCRALRTSEEQKSNPEMLLSSKAMVQEPPLFTRICNSPDIKGKAAVFKQVLPETRAILKGTDFHTAWQEASVEEKEILQHILEQEESVRMIWGKISWMIQGN